MTLRTVISIFNKDGDKVEALVQSMPRSFKMHVWAAPIKEEGTTVLEYKGTIQPLDQTDDIEIETLIKSLYFNEPNTRVRSA